jgi:cell division inhibitor SulA
VNCPTPAGRAELLCDHTGIGELALVLPALARLTGAGENAAWIAPPHLPYAPRLEAEQVAPQRLLLVRPEKPAVALWAAERVMRDGACAMAVLWLSGPVEYAALRRLQLAAAHGGCAAFIYRPRAAARSASPAPLRLELTPVRGRLAVNLMKRRGFANSRMLCIETASNRWVDLLEQPSVGVPVPPVERAGTTRAAVTESAPTLAASLRPSNLLSVRPHVPLVERRYPVPDR